MIPNARATRPKTVLITGASSGIGRSLALEYARGGAHVALVARRKELLDELGREVAKSGGTALSLVADVTKQDTLFLAVDKAIAEFGSLDMVIANAGVGGKRRAPDITWDYAEGMIGANVTGAIATLTAAIPHMVARRAGHLVGVSSLAGIRGLPEHAMYSASKAALSTFLQSIRIDLKADHVSVTDVQPGFVTTAMTAKNNFHMPFIWSPEKAAGVIAARLERSPAVIAFPWPLVAALRVARMLPSTVYERLVGLTVPR